MSSKTVDFLSHMSQMEDPRIERKKLYRLDEILLVMVCAVICGAESFVDISDFGKGKLDYLRRFLPFKHGVASHDTFRRVLSLLCPHAFQQCFTAWVKGLQSELAGVIAIDGKCLRHSFDNQEGKSAIYMVSAFSCANALVLGQEKVSDKSNEITAIPKLLDLLDVKGCIVSIDAIGCQKNIASQIVSKEADYVLSLKGNQGNLHKDIALFFEEQSSKNTKDHAFDYHSTTDGDHGRIETRECWSTNDIVWLNESHQWPGLKSIAMVKSKRTIGDKETQETRYYITSLACEASAVLSAIRQYWAIENTVHWTLDVTLKEDMSRIRKGNTPQNMATIRHVTLNMIQNYKKKTNMSVRRIIKNAGWHQQFLFDVMKQNFNEIF